MAKTHHMIAGFEGGDVHQLPDQRLAHEDVPAVPVDLAGAAHATGLVVRVVPRVLDAIRHGAGRRRIGCGRAAAGRAPRGVARRCRVGKRRRSAPAARPPLPPADATSAPRALPLALRCDNGAPFGSTGAGGLTRLSVVAPFCGRSMPTLSLHAAETAIDLAQPACARAQTTPAAPRPWHPPGVRAC